MEEYDVLLVGGGAAGFFAAINLAEKRPDLKIAILERGKNLLNKVKVSGGGRCNVTHAEYIPQELVRNYPRGERELLGPFHKFMTGDTVAWFEERGVKLKTEEDGRMFPTTDSSETIIDCFIERAQELNIVILRQEAVDGFMQEGGLWQVTTKNSAFTTNALVLATGSNSKIWNLLNKLGHKIINPVASLFTFNITDENLKALAGITTNAQVSIENTNLQNDGALLLTHWGLSGPAVLKLSAWGARILQEKNYEFYVRINWLEYQNEEEVLEVLQNLKQTFAKQTLYSNAQFGLAKRLWHYIVAASGIEKSKNWADVNKKEMLALSKSLTQTRLEVNGKSTFKEEFVSAGGVDLKEVDFKKFESKLFPNLFFAGEVLNVDAITGGFNFQNAWTGAYIVAETLAEKEI